MPDDPADFVVITDAVPNPPGADVQAHNGEYIVISNVGLQPISLDGWAVQDAAGAKVTLSGT
jgi:hypothetical protein